MVRCPPWCLASHTQICAIPYFATYRAIIVQYPTKQARNCFAILSLQVSRDMKSIATGPLRLTDPLACQGQGLHVVYIASKTSDCFVEAPVAQDGRGHVVTTQWYTASAAKRLSAPPRAQKHTASLEVPQNQDTLLQHRNICGHLHRHNDSNAAPEQDGAAGVVHTRLGSARRTHVLEGPSRAAARHLGTSIQEDR